MFTVIMSSLSFAFSTLSKTQTSSTAKQEDNASVRVVFDALKRDIQAAYASTTDPASVFIGNSAGSSSGGTSQTGGSANTTTVSSPGLLTFTTSSYRIQAEELNQAGGAQGTSTIGASGQNGSQTGTPQAGYQVVRYDVDSASGNLLRSVVSVPNLTLVTAPPQGDPGSILASGITSIQFQFWDPVQNSWRDSWDYEQSNITPAQSVSTGTTGATGGTTGGTSAGSTASSSSASNTYTTLSGATISASTGDVTFPTAVQITIEKINAYGQRVSYTTIIPIAAGLPYADTSTLKNTTSSSTTSGSGTGQ